MKLRSDRKTWHDLFIKEFNARRSAVELPDGKTLYVLNVPPYVQEEHLKFGFAVAGEVQEVILADKEGNITKESNGSKYFKDKFNKHTFKSAFILFKSTRALRTALQMNEVLLYQNNTSILTTGIEKWSKEYLERIPNEAEINAEVENYMTLYEPKEVEQREQEKQQEVDDEGWVTVKKGKNAGFEQKESILKKLEDKILEGKKKKQHTNFYTFQIRESKQQHIVSLRKRFEDDKRKIDTMKKARRFKPF